MLKAQNDLKTAEVAIRQDDPTTDTAIYHTQQCAEKALKGFLAYRQSKIQKIHHLVKLVEQCATLDSDFDSLWEDADELTPMGCEFRYPDDFDEIKDISQLFPTVEEVEDAIAKAKRILDFVLLKLPKR
jgi:HEPN domain-containing protein